MPLVLALLACGDPAVAVPVDPPATPAADHEEITLPNGLIVTLPKGAHQLDPRSAAASGLLIVQTERVDQTLGWGPATGTLMDAATHERGLVYKALGQESPDGLGVSSRAVAGAEGVEWTVNGGTTHFVGTSADACGSRLAVVSFGPAADEVLATHAARLASARCATP